MTPRPLNEDDLKAFAKAQIPPRRSFVVRLYSRHDPTTALVKAPEFVEMLIEAHNHSVNKAGALVFSSSEFRDQGLQGPGIYTFIHFTQAPGTWYDCREATKDMQTRAVAN